MRKIVGGFVFKDLPDWITCAQFFCLRDLKYINISITEEVCPFCIQELQIKTNNIYCNQKGFLNKYCDREIKEKYKQIQDVTFEIGIKILKNIGEHVLDYSIKKSESVDKIEIIKKIEKNDSDILLKETIEIVFEVLLTFYLRSKYFFKADKKYLLNDKALASTKKDIKKLLKFLWKEIKRRKSNQVFPKILVFCDESSELKTFVKKFEKLLKFGQNVGIYFIFAAQQIYWVSEEMLKHINSRILFRMFDGRTADEFIRTGEATKLKMGEYFYKCRNWDIVKCKPVNFVAKR